LLIDEKRQAYISFIKGNTKSIVSLGLIRQLGGFTPVYSEIAPLFDSLSDEIKNGVAGKEYAAVLDKIKTTAIGSVAPGFTLNDPDGKPVKLSDFRGKYLLIDFWASWCHPCREEHPNLINAYDKYQNKGFEILGISLDNNKEAWVKAISEDKLVWKNVADLTNQSGVINLYDIKLIPQNLLLDPSGKIVAKNLRGEELEKVLVNILKL